ncbi:MAG TPA: F0F1 ATP synthase subunit A [Nocardioidaceae bacterium]|jgi:F-type H+-transporting ATPase subunit a|nr:F0F1 ATP synthase subunit A [Nocardioidaceae bacterium]
MIRAEGIEIGNHVTVTVAGMTLNLDTIWSTVIAGAIVIGLGFWMRSKVTSGAPSKIQLMWEGVVNEVTTQVEGNLGRVHPFVVPLAVALFFFILISNWLELIPTADVVKAPTADVNLVYALALLVIVGVHIFGIRERGLKGYLKHYAQPNLALLPLNIIEEIVKPFTLALRLFGNIFAGGIMIALIAFLLPLYTVWGADVIWKLFDMFIGAIQAFIFALLTVLYFGMMSSHLDDHAEAEEVAEDNDLELEEAH